MGARSCPIEAAEGVDQVLYSGTLILFVFILGTLLWYFLGALLGTLVIHYVLALLRLLQVSDGYFTLVL